MCNKEVVLMPSHSTLNNLAKSLNVNVADAGYLYRKADRMLTAWHPSGQPGDRVPLTTENCHRALRLSNYVKAAHPSLHLTVSQIFEAVGVFNENFLMWRDSETDEAFAAVAEESLELAGLLDRPGDCPICQKGGYASARRHHICVRLLLTKARFKCGCGEEATNFYNWHPICANCEEHQAHLDALAD